MTISCLQTFLPLDEFQTVLREIEAIFPENFRSNGNKSWREGMIVQAYALNAFGSERTAITLRLMADSHPDYDAELKRGNEIRKIDVTELLPPNARPEKRERESLQSNLVVSHLDDDEWFINKDEIPERLSYLLKRKTSPSRRDVTIVVYINMHFGDPAKIRQLCQPVVNKFADSFAEIHLLYELRNLGI